MQSSRTSDRTNYLSNYLQPVNRIRLLLTSRPEAHSQGGYGGGGGASGGDKRFPNENQLSHPEPGNQPRMKSEEALEYPLIFMHQHSRLSELEVAPTNSRHC